jgi:LuxR family maltose regulon positive regulatory protein
MAIEDIEGAVRILHAVIARSLSLSEGADVAVRAIRLWLHKYGAAHIETDPAGLVELLIGLSTLARSDDVPAWLERVREAHPSTTGEVAALIDGAWAEHHQQRGQPLAARVRLAAAMDAVDGRPPAEGLLVTLHSASVRAEISVGDLEQAQRRIDHALAHPVGNALVDSVRHPGLASYVAALTGQLSWAEERSLRTRRTADELGLRGHEPGRIFAGLAQAEVHLERHHDVDALQVLDELARVSEATHRVSIEALISLHRARAARVTGDPIAAAALLEQARVFFVEPDAATRQVFGEEAALQALRFDPANAAVVIEDLDPARSATMLLRARLALLEGNARSAGALLGELPPPTTRRGNAERAVLCALSVLQHDVEGANHHLNEALVAGQPEGLMRVIVDQAPDVHLLLKSYAPDARQQPYVEQLIEYSEREVAPARVPVRTSLVEPLSEREITVLRYLCSRLTYQEIAAALYVSLNTLKSHVRSVYRKLGVVSRGEAVDAGRAHALI